MNKKTGQASEPGGSRKSRKLLKPREVISQSAERWLARTRSLVLRQTPVWAQSLMAIVISLGVSAITAGLIFRIDEVVTVTGQLASLGGSVDVKTPAGGKVSEVFFQDGSLVDKGQLLVRFDTREASARQALSKKLIELERSELEDKLNILESRKMVIEKKINTSLQITAELGELVEEGGFQKVQYLRQLDSLYELQTELSNVQLDMNRTKLSAEKP